MLELVFLDQASISKCYGRCNMYGIVCAESAENNNLSKLSITDNIFHRNNIYNDNIYVIILNENEEEFDQNLKNFSLTFIYICAYEKSNV